MSEGTRAGDTREPMKEKAKPVLAAEDLIRNYAKTGEKKGK